MLKGKRLHAIWTSVMVLSAVSIIGSAPASASYRVRPGDTVYEIAKRHHVSVNSVLKANGLTENSVLAIGRKLIIPGETQAKQKKVASLRKDAALRQGRTQQARVTEKAPERFKPWYEQYTELTQEQADNEKISGLPAVIRTAYAYRGTRYRFGGTSRSGFDCSGFTRYIYAKHGVSLPHSSRSQFNHGKAVSRSELQAGDLVFFSCNRSGISHVGIYIGDDKFIHASNVRRGVTIDSLNSAYYAPRYRGARRVQ